MQRRRFACFILTGLMVTLSAACRSNGEHLLRGFIRTGGASTRRAVTAAGVDTYQP